MGVRDEDGVQFADRFRVRHRPMAPEGSEPLAQQWIGQQADAVELDEQRRVAQVGDPNAVACFALLRLLSRRRFSATRVIRATPPARERTSSAASGSA